ncbi:MAG: hypothetical protein M0Z41_16130 [Peptococcaceae bacterium]|nr:hypothetical protein [Peptococcaceae bacterium]
MTFSGEVMDQYGDPVAANVVVSGGGQSAQVYAQGGYYSAELTFATSGTYTITATADTAAADIVVNVVGGTASWSGSLIYSSDEWPAAHQGWWAASSGALITCDTYNTTVQLTGGLAGMKQVTLNWNNQTNATLTLYASEDGVSWYPVAVAPNTGTTDLTDTLTYNLPFVSGNGLWLKLAASSTSIDWCGSDVLGITVSNGGASTYQIPLPYPEQDSGSNWVGALY